MRRLIFSKSLQIAAAIAVIISNTIQPLPCLADEVSDEDILKAYNSAAPGTTIVHQDGKRFALMPLSDLEIAKSIRFKEISAKLKSVKPRPKLDARHAASTQIFSLAEADIMLHKVSDALSLYSKFIEKFESESKQMKGEDPYEHDYFLSRAYGQEGACYLSQNDLPHAIESFTKAIKLRPDYGKNYYRRAVAYRQAANLDLAQKDEQKAKTLPVSEDELSDELHKAYRGEGLATVAVSKLTDDEIAQKLKVDRKTIVRKGGVRMHLVPVNEKFVMNANQVNELRSKEQALSNIPDLNSKHDPSWKYFHEGAELVHQDNYPKALAAFTTCLQLFEEESKSLPNEDKWSRDYHLGLTYYRISECYFKTNHVKLAIENASKAIALNPKKSEYYEDRAKMYRAAGLIKLAQQDEATAKSLPSWQKASDASFNALRKTIEDSALQKR